MKQKISYQNGIKVVEIIYENNEDLVDSDTKAERLSICTSCEYKDNEHCNQCNCILEVLISLVDKECPIGSW
jgi:hypothetical protein